MPCSPINDANFHPPVPPPGFPGIGNFAIQIPDLNIPFPDLPLEDLLALFDKLSMILPPGTLKPGLDADILNKPFAAFLTLLEKFMPFLMLYKFFLPMLNLIICIIEVLCAIPSPFKLPRALRRLFRVCLPEFLALFPFFALILMIIALLLLILALIEYLIQRILNLIAIIIKNIKTLALAARRLDNDSIIGITKKIGDLMCLFQNLFIIFGIISLIIQLIAGMLSLGFHIPPCDSSDGSVDGCCTTDVCPSFIKNNADGITNDTGFFQYYPEVGIDSGLTLPEGFPPIVSIIRNESWQFYDPNLQQNQQFINITNAFDLPVGTSKVFFPEGSTYNSTTSSSAVPYTINFRLFYNPTIFGNSDPKGARYIKITNAIVKNPPTKGVLAYDGKSFISPFDGTLNLVGGSITEDDGKTPIVDANGNASTINTLFHMPVNAFGPAPSPTDGVLFSNITYTFNINYEVLVSNSLITIGCMPDVAIDRDFINATIGAQFNSVGTKLASALLLPSAGGEGTAPLPDASAAQQCIATAVNTFRQNVSVETAEALQATVLDCLNTLKSQTSNCLSAVVGAGFDQYKSVFTLDTSIQFTTRPITVIVQVNESSGQNVANGIPADVAKTISSQLKGVVSFGEISDFTYDGYGSFDALITSDKPGNGNVKVLFNNNYISTINNPSSIDQTASVSINSLNYTFVDSAAHFGPTDAEPRHDEGDIARDNNG